VTKIKLIMAMVFLGFFSAGCYTFLAFRSGYHYTPSYCYDCHVCPRWPRAYVSCNYYVFRLVDGGYYYRPRHSRYTDFSYRTYDKKIVRDRKREHDEYIRDNKRDAKTKVQEKDNRKSSDKKPRRG
jgi:hypothetical protein